jgi:hypothetical protein
LPPFRHQSGATTFTSLACALQRAQVSARRPKKAVNQSFRGKPRRPPPNSEAGRDDVSQRSRNTQLRRPDLSRRNGELPTGKHAQNAPRFIGYGILLIALALIVIGSAMS